MDLLDVNVLVYAHHPDASNHAVYRSWLEGLVAAEGPFAISDLVLSGFLRVVTNPRIFTRPTNIDTALSAASRLREQPNCVQIEPGGRHWGIFYRLCAAVGARGGLVADAYFAALAIESGSEWITTDRDFSRFPGLRWRHPLEPA